MVTRSIFHGPPEARYVGTTRPQRLVASDLRRSLPCIGCGFHPGKFLREADQHISPYLICPIGSPGYGAVLHGEKHPASVRHVRESRSEIVDLFRVFGGSGVVGGDIILIFVRGWKDELRVSTPFGHKSCPMNELTAHVARLWSRINFTYSIAVWKIYPQISQKVFPSPASIGRYLGDDAFPPMPRGNPKFSYEFSSLLRSCFQNP
jgi:hypothetical protein